MKCGFLAGLVLLLLSMPPRVAAQETPTAAASGGGHWTRGWSHYSCAQCGRYQQDMAGQ